MKRIILFIALIFLFKGYATGQVAIVHDPTNFAKIGELFQKAQEQITFVKEQTQFLRDIEKELVKVNRKIETVRTIKQAIEQQSKYVQFFINSVGDVQESINPGVQATYLRRINSSKDRILDNTSYILQLLSDDLFKMSDYERMKLVKEALDESERQYQLAMAEKQRYKYINKKLIFLQKIANNGTPK